MSTSVPLLDVNVLVAFLWPTHVHHRAARSWFAEARSRGWATCPITELGCVRVIAGPSVSQNALPVPAAMARLRDFITDDRHVFWADDIGLLDDRLNSVIAHFQGPKQLTDRYLLALAASRDGTLATFDRSVAAGLPPGSVLLTHLEIIGA